MASYVGKISGSPVGSTLYGTCATAAATAAKVVTMSNFDTLLTGVTIHVKFTYSNTVANPTLNVNSTGAKAIMRYGETRPSTSVATSWNAGAVVSFTYDGTYWQMNDWMNTDTDTNTDTKVTSVDNHYTPTANTNSALSASASGATAAWSIDVVKGVQLQRDAKGHVTGVTVTSGKIPANPNTDTHYASSTITANSNTATSQSTSALTNGNVYLNHIENGAVKSSHKIVGSGATTVTTDASGNITISSTDNNTVYTHPSYTTTGSTGKSTGNLSGEEFTAITSITTSNGHITGYTTTTYDFPNDWLNDSVTQDNTTDNSDHRILLSYSGNDNSETDYVYKSSYLLYNPSTAILSLAKADAIMSIGLATGTTSGRLRIYSATNNTNSHHTIQPAPNSSAITHTLPATSGTILNTGTTSYTQSVASSANGAYAIGTIKINGTDTIVYGKDSYVRQVPTTGNGNYRVLLSYAANDITEQTYSYKSKNLTFNPNNAYLTIGYRSSSGGSSGSVCVINATNSNNGVYIHGGTGTVESNDVLLTYDQKYYNKLTGLDIDTNYSSTILYTTAAKDSAIAPTNSTAMEDLLLTAKMSSVCIYVDKKGKYRLSKQYSIVDGRYLSIYDSTHAYDDLYTALMTVTNIGGYVKTDVYLPSGEHNFNASACTSKGFDGLVIHGNGCRLRCTGSGTGFFYGTSGFTLKDMTIVINSTSPLLYFKNGNTINSNNVGSRFLLDNVDISYDISDGTNTGRLVGVANSTYSANICYIEMVNCVVNDNDSDLGSACSFMFDNINISATNCTFNATSPGNSTYPTGIFYNCNGNIVNCNLYSADVIMNAGGPNGLNISNSRIVCSGISQNAATTAVLYNNQIRIIKQTTYTKTCYIPNMIGNYIYKSYGASQTFTLSSTTTVFMNNMYYPYGSTYLFNTATTPDEKSFRYNVSKYKLYNATTYDTYNTVVTIPKIFLSTSSSETGGTNYNLFPKAKGDNS